MLKTSFVPLNREQFSLLREAKRLVSEEFNKDLILHNKNVLDEVYAFSMESKEERLYEIFNRLQNSTQIDPATNNDNENANALPKDHDALIKKIEVGDMINGKRCTGFYRGQPVFK